MGAAAVVMLKDEAASLAKGRPVWSLFAETPQPREARQSPQEGRTEAGAAPPPAPAKKRARPSGARQTRRGAKPKAEPRDARPLPADELPF